VLDIKKEVCKMLSDYISNENLSTQILKQKKSHIKSILYYSRKDPEYLLTEKLLTDWETHFKAKFGDINRLKKHFEKYRISNKIQQRRHWVLYHHPNLKLNYFKNIDSLEKAYWFGLLYADGSVYINKSRKSNKTYRSYTIGLELNVRDGILVKKFINAIGFNPKCVQYYKKIVIHENTVASRVIRIFRVRFADKLFAQNMINNGYILGNKHNKLRLPKLANRDLYLAFLLGFFDGDGKQGTTRITTSSKLLLEDIKSLFGLTCKIYTYKYINKAGKERISYRLHLGADLFIEMLDNFGQSLLRKRKKFIGKKLARKLKIPTRFSGPVKFKFSKDDLEKLVSTMSYSNIARSHQIKFGIKISPDTVRYWVNKWQIKKRS